MGTGDGWREFIVEISAFLRMSEGFPAQCLKPENGKRTDVKPRFSHGLLHQFGLPLLGRSSTKVHTNVRNSSVKRPVVGKDAEKPLKVIFLGFCRSQNPRNTFSGRFRDPSRRQIDRACPISLCNMYSVFNKNKNWRSKINVRLMLIQVRPPVPPYSEHLMTPMMTW